MTSRDDNSTDAEIEQLQSLASSSVSGIRPVTVRQLLNATRPYSDAKFSIDDIVADRVSTVAQVMDVHGRSSSITYILEDGTGGRITARQWLSDGGEILPEGHSGYVQVVGHLDPKAQSGSKNVLIVKSIRALTDPTDQLFFHLTQVAFVTLCLERGPPPNSALVQATPRFASSEPQEPSSSRSVPTTPSRPARGTVATTDADSRTPASPSRSHLQVRRKPTPEPSLPAIRSQPVPPPQREESTPADVASRSRTASPSSMPFSTPVSMRGPPQTPRRDTTAQGSFGGSKRRQSGIKRDPYAHLTVLQRAILLQILNTQYTEDGSDVFTISRGVAHHNPTAEQIGDEMDFLVNEGYIENTIDSGHYAIRTSHYPTSP
ncbi:hypothetical protein C8T65DRAFT_632160 [Cerioporus squamosus]|nr:hypothetical protein C8T65DRAFT_632160 [Cerioporus squamosus]